MLYRDFRLGGIERLSIGEPKDWRMRIPDQLLECVVFLCVEDGPAKWKCGGTGYFVAEESQTTNLAFLYFVTAKHCVEEAGSRLALRMNKKDGGLAVIRIENPEWHFGKGTSDVAVLWLDGGADVLDLIKIRYILTNGGAEPGVIKRFGIGPGDEIVVTGLFTHHDGRNQNRPIVRMGNIAAMPVEPIATTEGLVQAYIAEMRSIGGLSGSPAFVRLMPSRHRLENNDQPIYFWLGQIRGHWNYPKNIKGGFGDDLNRDINMGMALLTPVDDVLSVINGEELMKKRRDGEAETIKGKSPVFDSTLAPEPEPDDKQFMKADFESALRKVSRKLSDEEKSET